MTTGCERMGRGGVNVDGHGFFFRPGLLGDVYSTTPETVASGESLWPSPLLSRFLPVNLAIVQTSSGSRREGKTARLLRPATTTKNHPICRYLVVDHYLSTAWAPSPGV